jgi:outer membrane protein TolC
MISLKINYRTVNNMDSVQSKKNPFLSATRIFLLGLFSVCSVGAVAQAVEILTIENAYRLARKNYPLIKQRDLINKSKDYTVSNAAKGYLPMLSANGQATYQSDVTTLPFKFSPGITIPNYNKDQYKFFGKVDQIIYDGGAIRNQKQTANANEAIQQQNLEVELYGIYDRVNQLFFGLLLTDEQLKQNALLKADIQNGIDKVNAQVKNGTAYRSSVDELSAQLLETEQSRIGLVANKKAFLNMLGLFINMLLDENTIIESPVTPVNTDSINRPELLFYDYQKRIYDLQSESLKIDLRPKFSFFFQAGYARPGLNLLSNDFAWYYIGGLRLSWNFGSLYRLNNQQRLLDIDKQQLDLQKQTFLLNTAMTQKQESAEMEKYIELSRNDEAIIALRASVKKAASAQLENGVLTVRDYLTEVNAEDQATQNRILHEVEMLQTQYNYENTAGNLKVQ